MMPKKVETIKIAKFVAIGQGPEMVEWEAIKTAIPGLYLNRVFGQKLDGTWQVQKGWDITHKLSGLKINHTPFTSEKEGHRFIQILKTKGLDWDIPYSEIINDSYKPYRAAVRDVYGELIDEKGKV